MKIQYIKGNMFSTDILTIVHGCNAQGKMGSGVAKDMKELHPLAYEAYMAAHESTGLTVGQVIWAEDNGKVIGNAITQEFYAKRDKVTGKHETGLFVSYDGIRQAFRQINALVAGFEDKRVCLPMIGAGLGGGDWAIIEAIIEEETTDIQPVVYVR